MRIGGSELKYEQLFLVLLVLIATIMRLYGLSSLSYSNDELSSLFRLNFSSFSHMISQGVLPDAHPAGIQTLLYFWTNLFGTSEFAVKLPFVLAGAGSVILIYIIGKKWFGSLSGILSATSIAFLQFPLLYSRIARPYATGMFFILLTVVIWDRLLFRNKSGKSWQKVFCALSLGVAYALSMYNHYFSFLVTLLIGVTGLFYINRKTALWYSIAAITAIVLFIPHINITLTQLSYGGLESWLKRPEPIWLIQHLQYIFNNSWIVIITVTAIGAFSLFGKKREGKKRFIPILFIWFCFPLIIGYIYSFAVNPVIQNSVLIFSMPFLLLILFSYENKQNGIKERIISIGFAIVLMFSTVVGENFYETKHFSDFKTAGNSICEWYNEDSSTTIHASVNNRWYLDFYSVKNCGELPVIFRSYTGFEEVKQLRHELETLESKHFIFSKNRPSLPHVLPLIRAYYPYLTDFSYSGFLEGCWRFSRERESPSKDYIKPDTTVLKNVSFPSSGETSNFICINPDKEFFSLAELEISTLKPNKDELIFCEVLVRFEDTIKEAKLIMTTEQQDGAAGIWHSSPSSPFVDTGKKGVWINALDYLENIKNDKTLKIYIWNPGREKFFIFAYKIYKIRFK